MLKITLLTISLLMVSLTSFSEEDFVVTSEIHTYTIIDANNYESMTEIIGENKASVGHRIGFPVNELSELITLEVSEWSKGKWKTFSMKDNLSISTMSWSSFFSGTKYYRFVIPPGMKFKVTFATKDKHTIFLSRMFKKGWFDAENCSYSYNLPPQLMLTTELQQSFEDKSTFSEVSFDTLDILKFLIHPRTSEPNRYFSDWFQERIDPQLVIAENVIPQELKDIAKLGDKRKLAEACFTYVQKNVRYIDVENGINAVIPRHCEQVLQNGLGDCKDMATLLTALYRSFGMEAYSAISRTNSKEGKLDFPALGSANHTICALRLFDDWYFLDATEEVCKFGDPSIQILGTEVFLVGRHEGYYLEVPAEPLYPHGVEMNYQMDVENAQVFLTIDAKGKMSNYFQYVAKKEHDPKKSIERMLRNTTNLEWKVDSLIIGDGDALLVANTVMKPTMISKIGSKSLLEASFIFNPTIITALCQNNSYPLFDSNVAIILESTQNETLEFGASLKEPMSLKNEGNRVRIAYPLMRKNSEEAFEEDPLILGWKEIITKPIKLVK